MLRLDRTSEQNLPPTSHLPTPTSHLHLHLHLPPPPPPPPPPNSITITQMIVGGAERGIWSGERSDKTDANQLTHQCRASVAIITRVWKSSSPQTFASMMCAPTQRQCGFQHSSKFESIHVCKHVHHRDETSCHHTCWFLFFERH